MKTLSKYGDLLLKPRFALLFLFFLTISLRLLPFTLDGINLPIKDAAAYDSIGWNLAQGNGYVNTSKVLAGVLDTLIPPGFPFFLSGIYLLFGHHYSAVFIIHALLCAATGLLIYILGKSYFNSAVGLLAALLWAFYPRGIMYSNQILTETFFTFLLALFMLCLGAALTHNTWWWYLVAGALLGVLNLTRPVFLLLPLLLLLYFLVKERSAKSLPKWLAMTAMMAAVIAPWTARNYLVTGQFIPVRTMGSLLWISVNSVSSRTGASTLPEAEDPLNPGKSEGALITSSAKQILADPIPIILGSGSRLGILWGITPESPVNSSIFRLVQYIFWLIFLSLAILGAILGVQQNPSSFYLLLPIIYVTGIHTILHTDGRYREPYIPIILLFATFAILYLFRIITKQQVNHAH